MSAEALYYLEKSFGAGPESAQSAGPESAETVAAETLAAETVAGGGVGVRGRPTRLEDRRHAPARGVPGEERKTAYCR